MMVCRMTLSGAVQRVRIVGRMSEDRTGRMSEDRTGRTSEDRTGRMSEDRTGRIDQLTSTQRQRIKQEILSLLGLDHTPHPHSARRDTAAPRFMMSLYRSLLGNTDQQPVTAVKDETEVYSTYGVGSQLNEADIVMSFTSKASDVNIMKYDVRHATHHFLFDLSHVTSEVQPINAILRIYKYPSYNIYDRWLRIDACTQQRSSYRHNILKPIVSRIVACNYTGWINIDITALTLNWIRHHHDNQGVIIRVTNMKGRSVDPSFAGLVSDLGPTDEQPFLVGFFKSNSQSESVKNSRSKRSTDEFSEVKKTKRKKRKKQQSMADGPPTYTYIYHPNRFSQGKCQRHALNVSFRELNWQDWIIAPEGYAAFYCDGECTFPLHSYMNATNHAIVQTLANLMSPDDVPKPCCAPRKLSALSLLYFDDNSSVILKKYRNMVVRSCGCH